LNDSPDDGEERGDMTIRYMLGPIHITREEFENGGFKCFWSTLRRRNLKMQQSLVILDLRLKKNWQGNHMITARSSFSKSSISEMFSVHMKMEKKGGGGQIPVV